jgi:hypothetical protein
MSCFKVTLIGDTHFGGKEKYDGSELSVPDADLFIGLGDLAEAGDEFEYGTALKWFGNIRKPLTIIRGNHDNNAWVPYARQIINMPDVLESLREPFASARMGLTVWKPMIWEEHREPVLNLPRVSGWGILPAEAQNQIVILKDLADCCYTFEFGGMLFVCLDTSNWRLGDKQMKWLEARVSASEKPVVIAGHHHFLPVNIVFDTCQAHERDFLRRLILGNKKIIAYLCGHAHRDRWWKYGHADIITTRNRTCRSVTFKDGRVASCGLDGKPDFPEPFFPSYMCARTMRPGELCYVSDPKFVNPWGAASAPCLAWLDPGAGEAEVSWSLRLPNDIPGPARKLTFQIRSSGRTRLNVSAPGLSVPVEKELPPCPDGISVDIEIGPLRAGLINAKLSGSGGWGYTAMAVPVTAL